MDHKPWIDRDWRVGMKPYAVVTEGNGVPIPPTDAGLVSDERGSWGLLCAKRVD